MENEKIKIKNIIIFFSFFFKFFCNIKKKFFHKLFLRMRSNLYTYLSHYYSSGVELKRRRTALKERHIRGQKSLRRKLKNLDGKTYLEICHQFQEIMERILDDVLEGSKPEDMVRLNVHSSRFEDGNINTRFRVMIITIIIITTKELSHTSCLEVGCKHNF